MGRNTWQNFRACGAYSLLLTLIPADLTDSYILMSADSNATFEQA